MTSGIVKPIPLTGGVNTVDPRPLLTPGEYSILKNVRHQGKALRSRKGQSRLHTTSEGSVTPMSLYQFRKRRVQEKHLFAQMDSGFLVEATNDPPAVTTGEFGTDVFSGSAGQIPASWGNIGDMMAFSNGVDPHQIYPGDEGYVIALYVARSAGTISAITDKGRDYSDEVRDESSTTYAVLDALPASSSDGWVYIACPVKPDKLNITVHSPNTNAGSIVLQEWTGSWTGATVSSDTTASGGVPLAQTGQISWTNNSGFIEHYQFGQNAYWIRIGWSAALSATVRLSKVRFGSGFQPIENIWNGILTDLISATLALDAGTNQVYGTLSIDLADMTTSDKLLIASTEQLIGLFADVGQTPNETALSLSFEYWDGEAWQSISSIQDATGGLATSGFIYWGRITGEKTRMMTDVSAIQMYFYRMSVSAQPSEDCNIGLQGLPWFDISVLGNGVANCAWKDRLALTFDQYGSYIYVTATASPNVLNGSDYGILRAGDGRTNAVVAMRKFYNELMVWQEEIGTDGGCITLFEGYSPTTFGKIVLSSRIGTFSNKTVDIVDGVVTSTRTDEKIKALAFFLSHDGVCVCDGRVVYIISDPIQNYFDPTKPECIRRGYETEMWLKYDEAEDCIRVGLVSGTSATKPNVFPVYDLVTRTWSFDDLAQPLSTMENIEAASGDSHFLQIGGGAGDGYVYLLNTGLNDVSTAINAKFRMELSGGGLYLLLRELMFLFESKTTGSAYLTVEDNGVEVLSSEEIPMQALNTGDMLLRYKQGMSLNSLHFSVSVEVDSVDVDMMIYMMGANISPWKRR